MHKDKILEIYINKNGFIMHEDKILKSYINKNGFIMHKDKILKSKSTLNHANSTKHVVSASVQLP